MHILSHLHLFKLIYFGLNYNISSSVLIHLLIILLVIAGSNVVEPGLIVEVPLDGLLDAFLKLEAGFPSELALQFAGVDGVAQVVAFAVGDVRDQVHVFALFPAKQTVGGVDERLHDVDVLPLVETADVVGVGNLAFVENQVDRPCVIHHIQPVAHVLAFSVDRERLAVADVVDEQRDELLRELVRAVVVGAVRHDGRHAVGVVERPDEMVTACLARTVR